MSAVDMKTRWVDFATRLRPVGMNVFGASTITVTKEGAADARILALMLLSRTLSNLKAVLALTSGGFVVEAKTIARCCYENSYWVGALVKERDKFRSAMVQHEMKHKRMRAQTIFHSAQEFRGSEIAEKLRGWMREHKEYEDSPTLDPKTVAQRAQNESYMFYQHLSWDAHPSIQTLNRYFVPADGEGIPGIDVDPPVQAEEMVEMLNLMCLAVLGVFLGVGELVGSDNVEASKMAAEYQELTKLTGTLDM